MLSQSKYVYALRFSPFVPLLPLCFPLFISFSHSISLAARSSILKLPQSLINLIHFIFYGSFFEMTRATLFTGAYTSAFYVNSTRRMPARIYTVE